MPRKKGFKLSAEVRKRMSDAAKARAPRRKFSAEARRNMSLAKLGKPGHPHTEESKRKLSEAHTGAKSYRWKGGRKVTKDGYVMLLMPDHPNAYTETDSKTGKVRTRYVFEHRVVVSERLGRPLDRFDVIHHINGIRDDNRPENLEHLRGDNIGSRRPLLCPKCGHAF